MFVGNLHVRKVKYHDTDIFCLIVAKDGFYEQVKSGQFFNILPDAVDGMTLRRPISVGYQDQDNLYFYIKIAGKGTETLSKKKAGDQVNIMGPLGNGFDTSNVKGERALLIGGGIGVAPLIELGKELKKKKAEKVFYSVGFNNNPYGLDEMERHADGMKVYSKDNPTYLKGLPTDEMLSIIEKEGITTVYTCGPEIMMSTIVKKVHEAAPHVKVIVSVEERMGCGFGVCLCCSKIVTDAEGAKKTLCTCKEGPVFNGKEVYLYE